MKKELLTKKGNVEKAVEEFIKDLEHPVQGTTFALHFFRGEWQQRQFSKVRQNIPDNHVVMVFDFGKNLDLRNQDEAKSSYFSIKQATIHPVVMFYKGKEFDGVVKRFFDFFK